MHVSHNAYRGSVAGSRRTLAKRGSSGNLSVEGEDEQPSPGQGGGSSPPRSVGGGSTVVIESYLRRVQHVINVYVGLISAMHTDFFARRGLLTRLVVSILESVLVVVALTVIGTVIFSRLERNAVRSAAGTAAAAPDPALQDHELEVRYAAVMAEVRGGISGETYNELLYFVQNPREGDVWALSHQRCALLSSVALARARSPRTALSSVAFARAPALACLTPPLRSAYLFAFSTVTSIGYGVFTPVTQGGQLFFCFYGLFCIPLCGISFGRVATAVVDLLSWLSACHRSKIRKSFKAADTESRGYITQDEMKAAIESALHSTADVTELEELIEEIDPNDTNRITLKMYAWAFSQLGSLDERALQKSHRVRLAALSYATWNAVGMVIFHLSEGWSWVECVLGRACGAFVLALTHASQEHVLLLRNAADHRPGGLRAECVLRVRSSSRAATDELRLRGVAQSRRTGCDSSLSSVYLDWECWRRSSPLWRSWILPKRKWRAPRSRRLRATSCGASLRRAVARRWSHRRRRRACPQPRWSWTRTSTWLRRSSARGRIQSRSPISASRRLRQRRWSQLREHCPCQPQQRRRRSGRFRRRPASLLASRCRRHAQASAGRCRCLRRRPMCGCGRRRPTRRRGLFRKRCRRTPRRCGFTRRPTASFRRRSSRAALRSAHAPERSEPRASPPTAGQWLSKWRRMRCTSTPRSSVDACYRRRSGATREAATARQLGILGTH